MACLLLICDGMSFHANKDWRLTIDFTTASVNRASSLSAADERPLSIKAQASTASFGIDLLAAQLVPAIVGLGTSLPEVPLKDQGTSHISEDPSLAEAMMWLSVTFPLPIELRPVDTAPGTEGDSKPISRSDMTIGIEAGLAPVGQPREELSADPRSVAIDPVTVDPGTVDPVTVDLPTLDPALRFTPDPTSPVPNSPASTMVEQLLVDSTLGEIHHPQGDQTPVQPTVDQQPPSVDAPAPDAENTVTADRPTGFVSAQPNVVHTNISHAATPPSHSPGVLPVDPRTELSQVVRQVRTMVTEHETRTTIHLEPAELGRLTVELVDAPAGLRAHVSAEDPAVLRFLERNVQLLETEARVQGVGHMSFSVGADASGGPGRGDQRQSEAESPWRKNIEWNTHPQAKPLSRRELDTSA